MLCSVDKVEESFILGLDENPEDWDLRRVYADWLEDINRPDHARLQRWLIEHQKVPEFFRSSHLNLEWHWWGTIGDKRHVIGSLVRFLSYKQFSYKGYPSRAKAELDLLPVLIRLHWPEPK